MPTPLRFPALCRPSSRRPTPWIGRSCCATCSARTAAIFSAHVVGDAADASPVSVHRLTDLHWLEQTPAISPDGKSVAFTAYVGNKQQVWVRLVAGGAALQLTHDDADHESPRWAPDGVALLYYSPPVGDSQGTLWEMPSLGGSPRRVANSIGGGDISHDGKRIAFFRFAEEQIDLSSPRATAQKRA